MLKVAAELKNLLEHRRDACASEFNKLYRSLLTRAGNLCHQLQDI